MMPRLAVCDRGKMDLSRMNDDLTDRILGEYHQSADRIIDSLTIYRHSLSISLSLSFIHSVITHFCAFINKPAEWWTEYPVLDFKLNDDLTILRVAPLIALTQISEEPRKSQYVIERRDEIFDKLPRNYRSGLIPRPWDAATQIVWCDLYSAISGQNQDNYKRFLERFADLSESRSSGDSILFSVQSFFKGQINMQDLSGILETSNDANGEESIYDIAALAFSRAIAGGYGRALASQKLDELDGLDGLSFDKGIIDPRTGFYNLRPEDTLMVILAKMAIDGKFDPYINGNDQNDRHPTRRLRMV